MYARRKGIFDDICSHIVSGRKPSKWNYVSCRKEAKKYKNRGQFQKGNDSAYKVSLKNNWLDEFFPKK